MLLLEKIIRWLPGLIIVAGIFTFIFQASPTTSAAEAELPPEAGGTGLAGWWRWVESRRGDEVVRPTSADDSLVIVLGAYGTYRERAAGSVLRTGYGFAQGTLSQLQDSVFTVLVFDSSGFFPRTNGHYAVAIRNMTANSLLFSGTGDNATLYSFVRVTR